MGQERAVNTKEIDQQVARIEKMVAEGADEYDIKKQVCFRGQYGWMNLV
jgi:hypothetical protein